MNYGVLISLGIGLLAQVAHGLGWIDAETYQTIITAAGGGGVGSLSYQLSLNNKQSATRSAVIAQMGGLDQTDIHETITGPAKAPMPQKDIPPTAASNMGATLSKR